MEDREKKIIVWSDDNAELLEALQSFLKTEGYEVHCVATTAETIDLVRRLLPDLVITNLYKLKPRDPDSGLRIAETLRADPQLARTPIVLSTACCTGEGPVQGPVEPLFDDALPKPFRREECLALIRRLLNV
jgi:CheY-like chemotaxis protein